MNYGDHNLIENYTIESCRVETWWAKWNLGYGGQEPEVAIM